MNFECYCCGLIKSLSDWHNGVCGICVEEEE